MRKYSKAASSISFTLLLLTAQCICSGRAIEVSSTERDNNLRRVLQVQDNNTSTSDSTNNNEPFIKDKTNFCALSDQVDSGMLDRKDALRDIEITTGGHYVIDKSTGEIDEGYIAVLVLDELAKRAGFKWRNNVGVVEPPSANQTWTDVLNYTASNYDLALATWTRLPERLAIGITFPESWYDTGLIMVQKQNVKQTKFGWKLFQPFAWGVWVLIIVTMIISGLIYLLIDNIYYRGDKEKIGKGVNDSIFYSFQVLTGTSNFAPTYFSNRVLLISLRIFCIVVIAAYRANLTAILVNRSYNENINVLQDAIDKGYSICVWRGTPDVVRTQAQYPNGKFVEKDSPVEVYNGINNGECEILLMESDKHKSYTNKVEYNPDCDLVWVGRHVTSTKGSFGIKGSKELCSSLLHDVLDIYLLEMILDKTLDRLMKAYQQTKTNTCSYEVQNGAQRLTIQDVGGAFAFHAILLTFAVLLSLVLRIKHPRDTTVVKKSSEVIKQATQTAFAESSSMKPQSVVPPRQDQCTDNVSVSNQETKIQKMMHDLHEDLKDELRTIFYDSANKVKKYD